MSRTSCPSASTQAQRRLFATPSPRLAVDDVAAGDGEGAGGHQRALDLVLDLLDAGDDLALGDGGERRRGRRRTTVSTCAAATAAMGSGKGQPSSARTAISMAWAMRERSKGATRPSRLPVPLADHAPHKPRLRLIVVAGHKAIRALLL